MGKHSVTENFPVDISSRVSKKPVCHHDAAAMLGCSAAPDLVQIFLKSFRYIKS